MKTQLMFSALVVFTLMGSGCGVEDFAALQQSGQQGSRGAALTGDSSSAAGQGSATCGNQRDRQDRQARVQVALDAGDYAAWLAIMTEDGRHPQAIDHITADNFGKFVEAHGLMLEGKTAEADVIRVELGLPKIADRQMGQGGGMGMGKGKNGGNCRNGQGKHGQGNGRGRHGG